MATTAHFDSWLAEIRLGADGFEDVYDLYQSIKRCSRQGRFSCLLDPITAGKLVAVEGGRELRLATPTAEEAFLRLITGRHCGDLDMEGWFAYNSNLAKMD
jgi:hypothetical protein